MGYTPWHEVLKSVYSSVRASAFPITPMLQGLGAGSGFGNLQSMQAQATMKQQEALLASRTGYHPYNTPLYIPKGEPVRTELVKLVQNDWLTERVERVRLRGREWLTHGRFVVKTPKKSLYPPEAKTNRTDGLPTRRTAGGDLVYVYPEDHHVAQEVLDKWAASNAKIYNIQNGY